MSLHIFMLNAKSMTGGAQIRFYNSTGFSKTLKEACVIFFFLFKFMFLILENVTSRASESLIF